MLSTAGWVQLLTPLRSSFPATVKVTSVRYQPKALGVPFGVTVRVGATVSRFTATLCATSLTFPALSVQVPCAR